MDMVMVLGILGWEMMFWAGKFIDNQLASGSGLAGVGDSALKGVAGQHGIVNINYNVHN